MPGLTALPNDDGSIVVTRKFHEGVLAKMEHWGGPLRVLMEPSSLPSVNMDHMSVDPKKLPYELELVRFRSDDLIEKIRGSSVVLAMIGWQTSDVSRICRRMRIPSIYFTEYTLKTRIQIARAEELRSL